MIFKRVLVVGAGVSGKACVTFLRRHGAKVFVIDDAYNSCDVNVFADHDVTFLTKNDTLDDIDCMIISPGISYVWPSHWALQKAYQYGMRVYSDFEFFQIMLPSLRKDFCSEPYKVIAITGTNGKSTTTALIHHLLSKKYRTSMGGNIGVAFWDMDFSAEFFVLELSSYHLEQARFCEVDCAVLLNIDVDHLARHGGYHGYFASKQKIFSSTKHHCLKVCADPILIESFVPAIRNSIVDAMSVYSKYGIRNICGHQITCEQNYAASYVVAKHYCFSDDEFRDALEDFYGLEHRDEYVATLDGVRWINDSKATNAHACAYVMQKYDSYIWIAGGIAKEGGIDTLKKFSQKIRYAILFGTSAQEFALRLREWEVQCETVETLEEACCRAKELNNLSQTVLFSPACASFDQFQNFEHRGKVFKDIVTQFVRHEVE